MGERIRPLKSFEGDGLEEKRVIIGANQDRYLVDRELDLAAVEKELTRLKQDEGFDSIAVVLMHSYACPENELKVGEIAKKLGFS